MMKSIAVAGASILLLGTLINPALATNTGDDNNNDRGAYTQDQIDHCQALISQFDKTNTTNADAKALRNRAWNNCVSDQALGPETADQQITQALKMIGVTPKVM